MTLLPSLAAALAPHDVAPIISLGYDDEWREEIAAAEGLGELARRDQQMRFIAELGLRDRGAAVSTIKNVDAAISRFMVRGFDTGGAPSPGQIQQRMISLAAGAKAIADGLLLLRVARTGVKPGNQSQAAELERIHSLAVTALADHAIAPQYRTRRSNDSNLIVPDASRFGFDDPWSAGWIELASKLTTIAESIELDALRNPPRSISEDLVDFIHRLAVVFNKATGGRTARADRRKPTQPDDWHSPFVRFVREVWPLTPEGSQGFDPPEDGQIARALAATPSF